MYFNVFGGVSGVFGVTERKTEPHEKMVVKVRVRSEMF